MLLLHPTIYDTLFFYDTLSWWYSYVLSFIVMLLNPPSTMYKNTVVAKEKKRKVRYT